MSDYLSAACAVLGVERDQIVKHREEGGDLVLLVDRGIGGITKHYLAIAELPDPEPEATPAAAALAADLGLDLAEIGGTGVGGRILLSDVKAALADEEE